MAKILSVLNLKGGVGKTAIAVNFAAYCGRLGKKTLLVDLDPQTNATFSCIDLDAWEAHAAEKGTVADLLGARRHTNAEGATRKPEDIICPNVFPNVDLLPSHLDLFTIDLDLAGATARETKLKRSLADVLTKYDYAVCDCPPNLTIPTQNAIALSTHYAVPISPDYLSGIGVGLLLSRVEQLTRDLEHTLQHVGIILSRVGRPAMFRDQTVEALRRQFGQQMLTSEIRERNVVGEAAAKKKPIHDMGNYDATREFRDVSDELLARMGDS